MFCFGTDYVRHFSLGFSDFFDRSSLQRPRT